MTDFIAADNSYSLKRNISEQIRKGDYNALLNWVDLKKSSYYKIGWAYLHNSHDIEDAFQNTIIKIIDCVKQLRNESYFDTWATSIFINECRKALKQKSKTIELDEEIKITKIGISTEEQIDVENGLLKIDDFHKEILILKYYGGYSQEEIAKIQKIPIGTVKSRLYRALKALSLILKEG